MSGCPFCETVSEELSHRLAFAVFDRYPVSPGHLLLVTRRHVASFFDATAEEREALFDLADASRSLLDKRFHPDGYNLGVNVGEAAGQTIGHLHLHLIPRYCGDVAEPRGGVRGVIPARQRY